MNRVGIMGLRIPDAPWRETLDAAVLADELGYSSLTTGEAWGGDAFTTLAQFAAVTSRIGIGTSIVPVFARTPANIAMTALNLDRMSEGRFFLGLGTSGQLVIEDLHGERFAKPLARMREYVDIIRKATRGERLDHEGEFFHTKRFTLQIRPFRTDLPIYIASLGPESLRLTGELADGWLPIFLAPSRMATAVAEIKASAEVTVLVKAGENVRHDFGLASRHDSSSCFIQASRRKVIPLTRRLYPSEVVLWHRGISRTSSGHGGPRLPPVASQCPSRRLRRPARRVAARIPTRRLPPDSQRATTTFDVFPIRDACRDR